MLRIKVKKRFPCRSNFYHYCLTRNIEIRNFFSQFKLFFGKATSMKKNMYVNLYVVYYNE